MFGGLMSAWMKPALWMHRMPFSTSEIISLTTMTANGPVDITVDNEAPWNLYTRHQPSFGREQAKASKS
jgi:hypothetical protein